MSDRREFEKWLSEFLEFDAGDLERRRYVDDDGMEGYLGLDHEGHTENADVLASIAIQAWRAARQDHETIVKVLTRMVAITEKLEPYLTTPAEARTLLAALEAEKGGEL